MEFNFLGFVNRTLMHAKRTPVTSISTSKNTDAFRAQLSVNDALQDMVGLLRIKQRQTTFEFTTISGQRLYTIQKRIIYPFFNLRQKVTDRVIDQYETGEFDFIVPDDQSSGNPEVYYFEKMAGVAEQPASSGEQVYCVSSSGSDSGTVVIQGYDTSDRYISNKVILAGSTPVASASTFKIISSISKISTTGIITFRNLGDTTTYLTLAPKETHARLLTIGLHPIPNGVQTIFGRGWVQLPNLVNEYDVPIGFTDFHINAIIAGAYFRYMQYEPKFPIESLKSLYARFIEEIKKVTSIDKKDRIQHRMKSAYESRQPAFRNTRVSYGGYSPFS